VLALGPPLFLGPKFVMQQAFITPAWFAEFTEETVIVTVTMGSEVAYSDLEIELLPYGL